MSLGDAYAVEGKSSEGSSEVYVCPKGFAGKYRVRIHRVWGEVAAGKVTVDVYTHLRTGEMQHERQQLELSDKDAMVVFDLNHGRRTEPLEAAQLAGAVKRQETLSRSVLAQQIRQRLGPDAAAGSAAGCDSHARAAFFGRTRRRRLPADLQTLPEGTMMSAIGVVSADRRYVRIAVSPIFSTIGDVQTFTFAGEAAAAERRRQRQRQWRRCRRCGGGAVASVAIRYAFAAKQPHQDALLHVHPVGGLRDDHALRAVDHFVGHFFAAMRGQAVHEQRVVRRRGHQLGVHLVGGEVALAACRARLSWPMLAQTSV